MKILAVFRGLMTLLALFIGGQTLATEYKIKVVVHFHFLKYCQVK
ncbi:MAG: hypothetical protein CM15mP14_2170 [Rhodospirillaceae bacterium]|nr:MAG: hypothetical protein CM15mP14_2170 [Rhodospirillaceae bacterium]